MIKPIHEHDCDSCIYLGPHEEHGAYAGKYDLYWCPQGGYNPTLVARYGKEGDYVSGACFAEYIPAIREAAKRARILNLEVKS